MGPYSKLLERPPGPLDFPRNFNPHAVNKWFAACEGLPDNPRSAWLQALRKYRELCSLAGLNPYKGPDQDTDIAIRNYLFQQRSHLVRFLNVTRLMTDRKVLHNLKRSADLETYGFRIKIEAQLHIDDPTWIGSLFHLGAGYRFNRIRDEKRRYVLQLDPGLLVFVYNRQIANSFEFFIGYEIKVPIEPSYRSDTDLDREQKELYILDELWRPLMNTYRARNQDRGRHL